MPISEKIDRFQKKQRVFTEEYNSNKKEMLSIFHKEIEDLFLNEGCQIPKTLFRAEGVFNGKGRFALLTYNLVGITGHTSVPSCIHIEYKSAGWIESSATLYVPEISVDGLAHSIKHEKLFFTAEEAVDDAVRQLKVPPYE